MKVKDTFDIRYPILVEIDNHTTDTHHNVHAFKRNYQSKINTIRNCDKTDKQNTMKSSKLSL